MPARRGHGEGAIYQRGDGRWVTAVNLGWEGGKRKRKVVYGKTRKEVAEKLKSLLRDQQRNTLVSDEKQTVQKYLEWWLAEVASTSVRPTTAESYTDKIRLHVIPEIGRVRLARLTAAQVQDLLTRKLRSGLSPRSVAYIHAILRRALGQAEKWGLVSRNVVALVDPPRVQRPEARSMTPEEARAFLNAAKVDRLHALFAVALAIGLRRGEVLGLHWRDIDLDKGTLRVRTSLVRLGGTMVLSEPKSARSRRTIPLPSSSLTALREHRLRQVEERLAAGNLWQESGLVFTTHVGTFIEPRTVGRAFERICERARIGRWHLHELRHTCASLLLAQNIHPRVVMEVLGHSGITLTMNTYSHVLPALQQDAASRMEDLLGVQP